MRISHLQVSCCVMLSLYLLFSGGCAKTGEPHAPILMLPKPPTDLSVRQYGDQALVSVSMPAQNTNGSPVTTLARVEVFRLSENEGNEGHPSIPPGDSEFLRRAVKLFSVPAAQFPSFLRNRILTIRDPLEFSDHNVIYSRVFVYAARFVNNKDQNAGLTNQAALAPIPIPPAPQNLSSEVTQDSIRIRWDPPAANMDGSTPPRFVGYNVYKTEDPAHFPADPINREPVAAAEITDPEFQFDSTYYYEVSTVGSIKGPNAESPPSAALRVTPRDTFPPGAPQNLNAVVDGGVVILLWGPAAGNDVAGYRVYRREPGAAEAALLQPALITTLSYRDPAVLSGRSYVYRVTAVDTHGNEGAPAVTTVDIP